MDRLIEVKIVGSHITKDNKYAGVRGEAESTKLRISFDEGWDGYVKTITFWDAKGGNEVVRVLTQNLIEDRAKSMLVYLVPIPREPLLEAGMMTFIIDGYLEKRDAEGNLTDVIRQRSVSDELMVRDAPIPTNATEPTPPTPTYEEQFQGQFEELRGEIQAVSEAASQIVYNVAKAEEAQTKAEGKASEAEYHAGESLRCYEEAKDWGKRAEEAVGKTSYIGENGNWYAWNGTTKEWYDTGIRAQGGSEVYVGDNPPPSADVWINPDGDDVFDPVAIMENMKYLNEQHEAFLNELGAVIYPAIESIKGKLSYVIIRGGDDNWEAEEVTDGSGNVIGTRYGQVVNVNNAEITSKSKVDLQITSEQFVVFYEKDLGFVAENDGGVITLYCVGSIPQNDYTIQATVTEVETNA